MKSIIEECKIVENFTLLLYSRTYQTLYLQIFHSQNKNLLSKHVIKTSQHVTIQLGMPLNQIQMMVKKTEQSMQIMNDFKFQFEDFSTNSTVEQMDHYIKLKKKFPQYSLLFQIFYRIKSPLNSVNNLGQQEDKEALRISVQDKKKQRLNELKDITKSNLILLGFKVVNTLFRKQNKNKTLISSEDSLCKRSGRKNKKNKTAFFDDNKSSQSKKQQIDRSNFRKFTQVNTSRDLSKQMSVQDDLEKFLDSKNNINDKNSQERSFVSRKHKKNLTIDQQKSGFAKKRLSKKKITFYEEIMSKDICQDIDKSNWVQFQQNLNKTNHKKTLTKTKDFQQNEIINSTNIDNTLQSCKMKEVKQDYYDSNVKSLDERLLIQKTGKQNLVVRKLKKLCQQRSGQKILMKKQSSSKLKLPQTEPILNKSCQNKNQNIFKSSSYMQNKSKKFSSKTFLPNRSYESQQCFYENLYEKTRKSIERQNQIINFIKNQCKSIEFSPKNNHSLNQLKSLETFQDLKATNKSAETKATISKLEENKLKKVKTQDQFLKRFKIYLSNKKLRS